MREFWTSEQDELLMELFSKTPTIDICDKLGKSYSSVAQRATRLGLKKDPAYIFEVTMQLAQKLQHNGKRYQFKKGQVSWNKGKKMPDSVKEKVKATFFPKGHQPHNTKPAGHERISKDGYIEVRIRAGKYVQKHKLVWELEHGLVPKDKVLKFIDGNPLNCTVKNLMLISRADLMKLNTRHNWPVEIQEVIKLKNKINKQIDAKK
jgi:hypothetical protein